MATEPLRGEADDAEKRAHGAADPGGNDSSEASFDDWLSPTQVEDHRTAIVEEMIRQQKAAEEKGEDGGDGGGPPDFEESSFDSTEQMKTAVWQGDDPRLLMATRPGETVVGDRYRVVAGVADGGTAQILKVSHIGLGKEFALKLLPEKTASDPKMRQAFLREARVSSQMDHPNIVQVTDFGTDNKLGAYIVMEYLKGETLRARLNRKGRVRVTTALDVALQTAEALNYMHRLKIIHCDVKADNVFLCRPPPEQRKKTIVKLIDFGLSRSTAMDTTLARSEIGGTPQYVAPEQIQGAAPQPSMDIYSLGVLLYEIVTGSLPFKGTTEELLEAHQNKIPAPPSAVLGEPLDEQVEGFILRALSKFPEERQPSMAQMVFELRTLMEMLGVGASRRIKAVYQSRPGPEAEHHEAIFEHCPSPLFRLDRNGIILAANPAFCQFVSSTEPQMLGKAIYRTRLGNIYPGIRADLKTLRKKKKSSRWHYLAEIPLDDNRSVRVIIRLVPEIDDRGNVICFTGLIHRASFE